MADAAPTFPTDLVASSPMVPLVVKGDNAAARDSAILTANFVASAVIDCTHARKCALTIKYDANGSGTANTPTLLFMASNAATQPVVADDQWGLLSELEATGSDAVQSDSVPASVDFTVTPEFVNKKIRPLAITTYPSDNGTDKLRMMLIIDVSAIKYLCVLAKEEGDTTNLGTLKVDAALSA